MRVGRNSPAIWSRISSRRTTGIKTWSGQWQLKPRWSQLAAEPGMWFLFFLNSPELPIHVNSPKPFSAKGKKSLWFEYNLPNITFPGKLPSRFVVSNTYLSFPAVPFGTWEQLLGATECKWQEDAALRVFPNQINSPVRSQLINNADV